MITQEHLKSILHYDPETGIFTWIKIAKKSSVKLGSISGYINNGYVKIKINQKLYSAHRLAWLYIYGVWPTYEIDHIDCIRSNNKIINLRDIPRKNNNENRKIAHRDKKSFLPLGVTFNINLSKNKYIATISKDSKTIYLGRFLTPEEAHEAYLKAKRVLHDGCTI